MRLPYLLKNRNFYLMLGLDAALVCAALYLAFCFRFDIDIPPRQMETLLEILPLIVPIKLAVFYWCGLYYGMWRYTSLRDLRNVFIASLLSSLVILPVLFQLQKLVGIPRTVLIMDFVLTFLFISGIRVLVRISMNQLQGNRKEGLLDTGKEKRIAVLGAGRSGEGMVREMLSNPDLKMRPVALFDDDPGKWGKSLHGSPVIGDMEQLVRNSKLFDEILIALPSVKGERMRQIVDLCERTGKPYRIMPDMGELMDGQISVKLTRPLRYEDLLGREEVNLEQELVTRSYAGKRVMVTGAGGSIGSELVRQIGRFGPSELCLVDFSEYNLFRIDLQARQRFAHTNVDSQLVDVRDDRAVKRVVERVRPQIILHAAAYKHVPLQELNPWEAVHNNIVSTRNVIQAAMDHGAEKFVLVSTDKAVRPTNIMGATKRVAEMLVECANGHSQCSFAAVRFGNVLGSSGSVIPIFEGQIEAGMAVTVTHPEVTRYFMSVSEATQLILQAGAMADGGEVFILDMGRPVRIQDMARDLIRRYGLEPDKDIPIFYTGLRPGEKLYEELMTEEEGIVETRHQRIKVVRGNHCSRDSVYPKVEELLSASSVYDASAITRRLREIVPEYRPGVSQQVFDTQNGQAN